MLMMMLMLKKKKGSLAVVALLVASVNCVVNPTKENLSGEFRRKERAFSIHLKNSDPNLILINAPLSRDLSPGGEVPGQADRERRQRSEGDEERDGEVLRRSERLPGGPGEDQNTKRGNEHSATALPVTTRENLEDASKLYRH